MLESILNFLRRVFLGGCICLASSGNRVELHSDHGVQALDSSGNLRVQIPTSGTSIWIRAHDTAPGILEFGTLARIYASTTQVNFETADAGPVSRLSAKPSKPWPPPSCGFRKFATGWTPTLTWSC
jgi:hypothetical protein